MYSRSYNTQNSTKAHVPVESFGDSFSADAYLSQNYHGSTSGDKVCSACDNHSQKESEVEAEQHTYKEEHKDERIKKSECSQGCVFGDIKIDDLILIGLIIMFIRDGKNSNDYLIPILLAIILLF